MDKKTMKKVEEANKEMKKVYKLYKAGDYEGFILAVEKSKYSEILQNKLSKQINIAVDDTLFFAKSKTDTASGYWEALLVADKHLIEKITTKNNEVKKAYDLLLKYEKKPSSKTEKDFRNCVELSENYKRLRRTFSKQFDFQEERYVDLEPYFYYNRFRGCINRRDFVKALSYFSKCKELIIDQYDYATYAYLVDLKKAYLNKEISKEIINDNYNLGEDVRSFIGSLSPLSK